MSRHEARKKRKVRVRKKVSGTPARPRLSVFRSSKHIYAQLIDDLSERTLAAASSLDPELRGEEVIGEELARQVGQLLGKRALSNGIERVVFDRGGYKFHGQIAALAEGARDEGLAF